MPSHGTGKDLYYIWNEVFDWWRKREYKALHTAASKKDGRVIDKGHYEAVEQQADAEMKLLKLAEARRQLVSLGDVERKMSALMAKVRTQCLSIRSRVLSEVGKANADIVHREVELALSLLASSGDSK